MGFVSKLLGMDTKTQATQLVSPGATNVTEDTTSTARDDAKKQRKRKGFASTQLDDNVAGKTTLG